MEGQGGIVCDKNRKLQSSPKNVENMVCAADFPCCPFVRRIDSNFVYLQQQFIAIIRTTLYVYCAFVGSSVLRAQKNSLHITFQLQLMNGC